MNRRGTPEGPVVLLGSANSVFTADLARVFVERGYPVKLVSLQQPGHNLPESVDWIDARPRSLAAKVGFRLIRPFAHQIQKRWMKRSLPHFQAVTGKQHPDEWQWAVWDQFEHAWRLSRLVLRQRPRCVIGQELAGYGVSAALCRGIPRILHPWGSDIFFTPESWPGAYRLIHFAVHHCELLIPSSVTAAQHLVNRFGVPEERVLGLSFGIDPSCLVQTSPEERAHLCAAWGIDPGRVIVQNARRFRQHWGCEPALAAFLQVAREAPHTHFVLIGGASGLPEIAAARQSVEQAGLADRFTILDRRISPDEYQQLARITDISVSLMGRGDMRSASVLIHAATGSSLVIAEHPEFRVMEQEGLRASFVNPSDIQSIVTAITTYIDDPKRRSQEAEINQQFILEHENQPRQMDRIIRRINETCEKFYHAQGR